MMRAVVGSVLSAAGLVFVIWMLVDAARRGADFYWYFIILFGGPVGAVAYFFVIKLSDFRGVSHSLSQQLAIKTGASVKELRYQLKQTPSVANRLALATALYDKGELDEAASLYEEVLASHPEEKPALHGLGRCRLEQQDFDRAVESLRKVVDNDPSYAGYASWRALAAGLWARGDKTEALDQMDRLSKRDTRVGTRADYADYLIQSDRKDEARALLDTAIEDYRHSPGYVRRNCRAGYAKARRLLKGLG